MKKITYIITLLTLTLWSACEVEDKGHYDYTPLNELTIAGIESGYAMTAQIDTLVIVPRITVTVPTDESNYEYSWFFCSGDDHVHTQISTERNLNWRVVENPGIYTLYYQITDNSTGLQWITSTALTITTNYTIGFLLLGDEPDSDLLRMDMIMMPSGRDTIVGERVFQNESGLRNVQSMIFTGATNYGGSMDAYKALYLMTDEKDIKITSGSFFEELDDFNNLDIIETEYEHATPMRVKDVFPRKMSGSMAQYRCRSVRGYITEDMIVMGSIIQTEYFTTPINKYSESSMSLFRPYPLAFVQGTCNYSKAYPIFYDLDAECFVTIARKSTASQWTSPSFQNVGYCAPMTDYVGEPFPWNQASLGRTIVYGENGYKGGGDSYALMIDQEGNYYIYVFRTSTASTWLALTHTKLGCYEVDPLMAQGFDQASHYAFLSDKYVILYSVGSMLYAYDYTRSQITSMDMGAEITCLEVEYCSNGSLTDIILATFDETSKSGVVQKLTIGGGNNSVTIEEKPDEIWPVTMRVKDIEWKYSIDNTLEEDLLGGDDEEEE